MDVIQKKGDPPLSAREQRKILLMRSVDARANTRINISLGEKSKAQRPKPITLPPTPWDKK